MWRKSKLLLTVKTRLSRADYVGLLGLLRVSRSEDPLLSCRLTLYAAGLNDVTALRRNNELSEGLKGT